MTKLYTLEDLNSDFLWVETNKCQKIKIQDLLIAKHINYEFIKVITLTNLFCK